MRIANLLRIANYTEGELHEVSLRPLDGYSSNVFSIIRVIITAIGTASNTQTIHRIMAQIIILMKMTTGFTPNVLFINNGINTLFSNRWSKNTTHTTINAP